MCAVCVLRPVLPMSQSNMQLMLEYTFERNNSIAAIKAGNYSNIRVFAGPMNFDFGILPTHTRTHKRSSMLFSDKSRNAAFTERDMLRAAWSKMGHLYCQRTQGRTGLTSG